MIPKRLIRTVPTVETARMKELWAVARRLHPGWDFVSWVCDPPDGRVRAVWRPNGEPLPPVCRSAQVTGGGEGLRHDWALTRGVWDRVESGAQLADLVRLEDLYRFGGVYIDSDVLCVRSFESLLGLSGFAGWDDTGQVGNAVLGFEPGHGALLEILRLSVDRVDAGTHAAGVPVCTEVLSQRDDVALFPPSMFYPVPHGRCTDGYGRLFEVDWAGAAGPGVYAVHQFASSWMPFWESG